MIAAVLFAGTLATMCDKRPLPEVCLNLSTVPHKQYELNAPPKLMKSNDFQFAAEGGTILTFKASGEIVPGPHLSNDEATRKLFDTMTKLWPGLIDEWAKGHGWVKP